MAYGSDRSLILNGVIDKTAASGYKGTFGNLPIFILIKNVTNVIVGMLNPENTLRISVGKFQKIYFDWNIF